MRSLPLLALCALAGCHSAAHDVGTPPPPLPTSYRGAVACDEPRVPDADGTCVIPGISSCVDAFRAPDGTCRPSAAACPTGTIPAFGVGCTAVGIPSCAPVFLGDDGVCRAKSASCPDGTYPVPSEGCVPYDRGGCAGGKYADVTDGSPVIHVDASSTSKSPDGSEAAPFAKIAPAVASASPGTTILIAAGKYPESLELTTPVRLLGTCPSQVAIGKPPPDPMKDNSAVHVKGTTGVSIRGVSIVSSRSAIVVDQAELDMVDVRVAATVVAAIGAQGYKAVVTLDHVVVEDTAPGASNLGHALEAIQAARISAAHSAFLRSSDVTAFVSDAASGVSFTDVTIDETLPNAMRKGNGVAINVQTGAAVTLDGCYVGASRSAAVLLFDAGSQAAVASSVIDDTGPLATGLSGNAVDVEGGATASIDASVVLRSANAGAFALGHHSSLSVSRTLIADGAGYGVVFGSGARGSVESSALLRNATGGVIIETARVGLQQVLVEGPATPAQVSRALWVRGKASVDVADCAFRGSTFAGVYSDDEKTTIALRTSLITGTRAAPASGLWGFGLWAFYASVAVDGCEISDSVAGGVVASAGDLTLTSTLVRDVAPGSYEAVTDVPEAGGDGIVLHNSTGLLDGAVVRRASRAGILVANSHADIKRSTIASSAMDLAITRYSTVTIDEEDTFDVVRNSALTAP